MMPSLLCSLRSSFREAGSRRYRPSSPASMVRHILSSLFLVLCPSVSSCVIPPPSSCTLVLVFVFFHDRRLNHTIRPSTAAPPSLPPSPAYTPGALSTHQLSITVSSASAHAPNRLTCLRWSADMYCSHRGGACLMSTALTQLHHTTPRPGPGR